MYKKMSSILYIFMDLVEEAEGGEDLVKEFFLAFESKAYEV